MKSRIHCTLIILVLAGCAEPNSKSLQSNSDKKTEPKPDRSKAITQMKAFCTRTGASPQWMNALKQKVERTTLDLQSATENQKNILIIGSVDDLAKSQGMYEISVTVCASEMVSGDASEMAFFQGKLSCNFEVLAPVSEVLKKYGKTGQARHGFFVFCCNTIT